MLKEETTIQSYSGYGLELEHSLCIANGQKWLGSVGVGRNRSHASACNKLFWAHIQKCSHGLPGNFLLHLLQAIALN